jgi:hypothetical protein
MFGMSGIVPEIYKRMGFETLTVGRVNKEEITKRGELKTLEFLWSG